MVVKKNISIASLQKYLFNNRLNESILDNIEDLNKLEEISSSMYC